MNDDDTGAYTGLVPAMTLSPQSSMEAVGTFLRGGCLPVDACWNWSAWQPFESYC